MEYEKMSKKELIEKLRKIENETEKPKEKIQIKNRFTGKVIFESETATTIKECIEEAVKSEADLSGANLWKADLSGANLSGADLWKANLSEADLSGADLWKADLWKADLSGANLSGANLSGANLSGADLSGANLSGANLSGANLSGVDLVYCKMDKKVFKEIIEGWFEWEVRN